MQPSPQMINMNSSPLPPANITTEEIQKFLDENKKLIMAIMENQNLGKLAECAQYQAHLQKNLMYLAAIADAQPPPPTPVTAPVPAMTPQMTPHSVMQPPNYFMQHPQASGMHQQASPGIFPPRGPMQFSSPQQRHDLQQQQLQAMQGHMGMRPMSLSNNGMQHSMHHLESSGLGNMGIRGGKQDGLGAEGQAKDDGK